MKLNWNLRIRTKIYLFFGVCLALIFSSLTMFVTLVMKPEAVENASFTISQINESRAEEVNAWVGKKALEYRIMSAIPAFSSMDVREITPLIDRFTSLYTKNGEIMETFTYIGRNGFCWINNEATEELMDYEDYRMAYESEREFVIGLPKWNRNNREVMLFYYPVVGYGGVREALLCSAVPSVGLKEIVNTEHVYGGKTWVMNRDHEILSTDREYFYENYLEREALEQVDTSVMNSSGRLRLKDGRGREQVLFYAPVARYPDWVTCTLVSVKELSRSTDELLRGCGVLFLMLMAVTALLGMFLTYLVMKPIGRLKSCMDQVEEGSLSAYYDSGGSRDEIYELGLTYNKMLSRIRELIDRIYREQEAKRQAEIKVMQAQIKPHFLYNTLDNLKWMAKEQGAGEVAATITSLSTFFRIFLSNGQEMITVREEFKHTKAYLDIQKVRYRERLSFTMELDEELKGCKTLKMMIQPMVENAIYHGIKPKDGPGQIRITGRRDEDFIEYVIEDDGVGMTEEELLALTGRLERLDASEHFGMVNTLTRLRATYGEDASIRVMSRAGEGTRVVIRFKCGEETICTEQW